MKPRPTRLSQVNLVLGDYPSELRDVARLLREMTESSSYRLSIHADRLETLAADLDHLTRAIVARMSLNERDA